MRGFTKCTLLETSLWCSQ